MKTTLYLIRHAATEANLADYFRAQKIRFTAFPFDRIEEAWAALLAGRCEALTADISALHAMRASLHELQRNATAQIED